MVTLIFAGLIVLAWQQGLFRGFWRRFAVLGYLCAWFFGMRGPGARLGWVLARYQIEAERRREAMAKLQLDMAHWRTSPARRIAPTGISQHVTRPDPVLAIAASFGMMPANRPTACIVDGRCRDCGEPWPQCPKARYLGLGQPSPVCCTGARWGEL